MFGTTIAGSLPKPAWLAEPEKLWAAWHHEGAALERAKQDAALVWLKEQESAGIDIVSDSEQFRTPPRPRLPRAHRLGQENQDGHPRQPLCRRRAHRDGADPPQHPGARPEAAFTRSYTDHKLKFTLPGPMMICETIADAHYGRRADMAMAFAAVLNQEAIELEAAGVDVIQFRRARLQRVHERCQNVFMNDVKEWGVAALHRAIEGLRCTTAVHICYGYGIEANIRWKETLGSEWRQYEEIFPALNASRIGQVNFHVPMSLIGLLKDKDVLLGAIDVATNQIETPEQVAAVIRQATAFVDPKQIFPCTNCGLARLRRDVAIGKLKALGAGAALARKE